LFGCKIFILISEHKSNKIGTQTWVVLIMISSASCTNKKESLGLATKTIDIQFHAVKL